MGYVLYRQLTLQDPFQGESPGQDTEDYEC